MAPAARAPAEFDKQDGFRFRTAADLDRGGAQLGRDALEQFAVSEDIDAIDEPGSDCLDIQGGVGRGRGDAALHGVADRRQQVDIVAGQRVGATRPHGRKDRVPTVICRVDRHATMAVGAGEGGMMIGIADHAEHRAALQPRAHGRGAVHRAHGMQVGALGFGLFRATMHRKHLDEGRQFRIERIPVDAARALAVADMVRKGEGVVALGGLKRLLQFGRAVGKFRFGDIEVAIDDRVVAMFRRMDLVAGKHGEAAGILEGFQHFEMVLPVGFQLCETLDVEIDDMGDLRHVDRHIGPGGMSGDGDEVELQGGPR